jgi:hypothetical protein
MQMIRDVTGLNEARDGAMPDPNALVGLQKMAANASKRCYQAHTGRKYAANFKHMRKHIFKNSRRFKFPSY